MSKRITAIIVGAGHRGLCYANYARQHPDELKIVGVADPNEWRRKQTADIYGFGHEMCFESAEELASKGQLADAIINATMDTEHVPTSLPLLEAGYHMLLEKPIATRESEVRALLAAARKHKRTVMICHVLRYAPFYAAIRQKVLDGEIGEITNVMTVENVSYHHMGSCFVRGKWSKSDDGISMLMAKCCHDLDLITWMKSGVRPLKVASFGGLMHFKPENAPTGSGSRCLVDCSIEQTCAYSCRKHYIEQGLWAFYAWQSIEHEDQSVENKLRSLREDNPHGRCVWRCDNDVVDHQTAIIEFADGSTASHNMNGGTSRPCRSIHLVGTTGEIQGVMEEGSFVVRHPDARAGHEYSEDKWDVNVTGEGHGGGDLRLVADFVHTLQGKPRSISCTDLEDSIFGHLIGFAADRARIEHNCVEIVDQTRSMARVCHPELDSGPRPGC